MVDTVLHRLRGLAVAAAMAALAWPAAATDWKVTVLSAPGSPSTTVWDVNNLGQVAGSGDDGLDSRPFVYRNGHFDFLSLPGGALGGFATGLSDNGVVVGGYYTQHFVDPGTGAVIGPGPQIGFVQDASGTTSVLVPGAVDTYFRGVSPDGRYVSGVYNTETRFNRGFVFDRVSGQFTDVPENPLGMQSSSMIVQGINRQGVLVGSETLPLADSAVRGSFTYDVHSGLRTDFGFSDTVWTSLRDIDGQGRMAGWVAEVEPVTSESGVYGIVGTPGAFEPFLTWQGQDPAATIVLQGLNDAGWVSGNLAGQDTSLAFLAVPVPEPATAVLLLAGLAGLAARRRAATAAR